MSDHVWLSTALTQVSPIIFVKSDISENNVELAIQAITLNQKGQPISQGMCPKRIWAKVKFNHRMGENWPSRTTVPHLFFTTSHIIVSSKVANILREFDLGAGGLYPVTEGVFQDDNQTQIDGEYFTWNFGNTRTAFLEQHSPNVEGWSSKERRMCQLNTSQADDDIAVSSSALSGPDVWVDPVLFKSIFLSGPLGDALVEAGLKQALYLLRCRVI